MAKHSFEADVVPPHSSTICAYGLSAQLGARAGAQNVLDALESHSDDFDVVARRACRRSGRMTSHCDQIVDLRERAADWWRLSERPTHLLFDLERRRACSIDTSIGTTPEAITA
jgi:hypothetical protein